MLNGIAEAGWYYSFDTVYPLTAFHVEFSRWLGFNGEVSLSQTSRPPID